MRVPTAPVAAGSLVAGYLVARETGVRPLGGAVLAGSGAWLTRSWTRSAGPATAGVLLATYLGGFGGSHPLAKRIGAWPSVLAVAGVAGAASWALADRRA
jgi:hypothetical protein